MTTRGRGRSVTAADHRPPAPGDPARVVEWLAAPATHGCGEVEIVETHFAWVFLAGARAYKVKKPARVRGGDLRDVGARERACARELALNRRLAAWTYRGLRSITTSADGLAFEGAGHVVDWAIEMRRLDRTAMLDARLRAGTASVDEVVKSVVQLRALDGDLPLDVGEADPPVTPAIALASVERRAAEALHEIARPEYDVPAAELVALARALGARIREARDELAARAWHVRDGHGDLRAEHVWLGRPVQIIDAMEFDPRLRRLDAAEDVAMLAIDAEMIAGAWPRRALCGAYEMLALDCVPHPVWQVYLGLRAAIRAKVALWHLDVAGHGATPDDWRTKALRFAALAVERLESPVYE